MHTKDAIAGKKCARTDSSRGGGDDPGGGGRANHAHVRLYGVRVRVLFHDLLHVILVVLFIVIIVIHRYVCVRCLRRIQLRHALCLDLHRENKKVNSKRLKKGSSPPHLL